MGKKFIHTADNQIIIDDLVMPLDFFETLETEYELPAGAVSRQYFQENYPLAGDPATHILFTRHGQLAGILPYSAGDDYISNKAAYAAAYAAYVYEQSLPDTLEGAKLYQIDLARKKANEVANGGVKLNGVEYATKDYQIIKNNHLYATRNSALLGDFYLRKTDGNRQIIASVADLTGIMDLMTEFAWEVRKTLDDHIDAINALTTIADVYNYDYETGYPAVPYDPSP